MTGTDRDGDATRLAHAGRDPGGHAGAVNIPPYRASTILFPTLEELDRRDPDYRSVRYGRLGTPSSHAFEEAMAGLEGGFRAVSFGSGLQAITTGLLAFLGAGDHALIVDTCYGPTREFCTGLLLRYGVDVEFYDPAIGGAIAERFRPNTKAVLLESPGSLTFEVQDVPAIAAACRARGIVTLMDNTWSAGLFHKPLALGVDVSLQSATKYVCGHADANLGVAVCNEQTWRRVKDTSVHLGTAAGADDLFLGLRGLRTLSVRLQRHFASGLAVAQWLSTRPEVVRVLHPALPGAPGHDLWRRDFSGASGLFAVELAPCPRPALAAMVDGLRLFGMGFSWGGFESLILPVNPRRVRTAVPWAGTGQILRLHVGLEEPDDLIADLEAGFGRLAAACQGGSKGD